MIETPSIVETEPLHYAALHVTCALNEMGKATRT